MGHAPECNDHWCYCLDLDEPDPMCDCGEPGWMCRCAEIEEKEREWCDAEDAS